MTPEEPLPNRRSIRMPGYDYRMVGGYFVTICAFEKRCIFGKSENGAIRLHPYGRIVEEEWQQTAALRGEVTLDQYVIMPNHFHAIIMIRDVGAHGNAPALSPKHYTMREAPERIAMRPYGHPAPCHR